MKVVFAISILVLIGCSTPKKIFVESKGMDAYYTGINNPINPGECYGAAYLKRESNQSKNIPFQYKTGFFFIRRKGQIQKEKGQNRKRRNRKK